MKVKLLKKIRKQYSIVYYPNRKGCNFVLYSKNVVIYQSEYYDWALDRLFTIIREKYYLYSREFSNGQKKF